MIYILLLLIVFYVTRLHNRIYIQEEFIDVLSKRIDCNATYSKACDILLEKLILPGEFIFPANKIGNYILNFPIGIIISRGADGMLFGSHEELDILVEGESFV